MLASTLLHITNVNHLTKKWTNFVKIKFYSNESYSNTWNWIQIQLKKMRHKLVYTVLRYACDYGVGEIVFWK
jgi:CRISPR/Cas system CSM-associated protein Csm2 small subunit